MRDVRLKLWQRYKETDIGKRFLRFEKENQRIGFLDASPLYKNDPDTPDVFSDPTTYASEHKVPVSDASDQDLKKKLTPSFWRKTFTLKPLTEVVLVIMDNFEQKNVFSYRYIATGVYMNVKKIFFGAASGYLKKKMKCIDNVQVEGCRLPRKHTAYAGAAFKTKQESDLIYHPALYFNARSESNALSLSRNIPCKRMYSEVGFAIDRLARGKVVATFGSMPVTYHSDGTPSFVLAQHKGSREWTVVLSV